MGITVVTSANLSASGNAATGLQSAAEGSTDFSDLLGLQLANPQLFDPQLQAMTSPRAAKGENADDRSGAQDPASLLAAAGLLPALLAGAGQNLTPPAARPANGDGMPAVVGKAAGDLSSESAASKNPAGAGSLLDIKSERADASKDGSKFLADISPSAKANNAALADAANIAADAQSGANTASNFAATLAAHAAGARPSQNESAAAAPQISVPLHDSRWAQDFGERVVWLAKNDQQTAQININPPQLGPMHITLNLSGDQASALFVSPHAEVRQAIQDAMPQLREMLAGAGINLGQSNVGAQLPQQNSGTSQQSSDASRFGNDNAILHGDSGHGATALPQPARNGRGMVDLFA